MALSDAPSVRAITAIQGVGVVRYYKAIAPAAWDAMNQQIAALRDGGIDKLNQDVQAKRAVSNLRTLADLAMSGLTGAQPSVNDAITKLILDTAPELAPLAAQADGQRVLKAVANVLQSNDLLRSDLRRQSPDPHQEATLAALADKSPGNVVKAIRDKNLVDPTSATAQPADPVDMEICDASELAGLSPDALTAPAPGADIQANRTNKDGAVRELTQTAQDNNLDIVPSDPDERRPAAKKYQNLQEILAQTAARSVQSNPIQRVPSLYETTEAVVGVREAVKGQVTASSKPTANHEVDCAGQVFAGLPPLDQKAVESRNISADNQKNIDAKAEDVREKDPKGPDGHAPVIALVPNLTRIDPHFSPPDENASLRLPAANAISGGSGELLSDVRTIEAWVRADWDPASRTERACIVSLSGPIALPQETQQAELSVLIEPDAQGLIVLITGGTLGALEELPARVPFDFSDGQFHHITVYLSRDVDFTRVVIDEHPPVSAGGLPFINFLVNNVTVGARRGRDQFEGRIGRLTLWKREVFLPELITPQSDDHLMARLAISSSSQASLQFTKHEPPKPAAPRIRLPGNRPGPPQQPNVVSQPQQPKTPVESEALKMPTAAPVIGLDEGALLSDVLAIEAWIRADFTSGRTDRACVLSMSGIIALPKDKRSAELAVFISPDAKQLIVSFPSDPDSSANKIELIADFDLSDGKFHHLTIFFSSDTGTTEFSLDGVTRSTLGGRPFINHWLGKVTVGSRNDGEKFEGHIAQLSVWNRQPTDAEALHPVGDDKLVGRLVFSKSNEFAPLFRFHFIPQQLAGPWVSVRLHPNNANPQLKTIPGIEDHCSYQDPLFAAICEDEGTLSFVIDDGNLTQLTEFAPVPGRLAMFTAGATKRTVPCRLEFLRTHTETQSKELVAEQKQLFQIEYKLIAVEPASEFTSDFASAEFNAIDIYSHQHRTPDKAMVEGQTLDTLFASIPSCFDCGQAGFNLKTMDPQNYFKKSAQEVFTFRRDIPNYNPIPGGNHQLPYGWVRAPVPAGSGGYKTKLIQTGLDLMNSRTADKSMGASFIFFSFAANKTYSTKQEDMYENETMRSVQWSMSTVQDLILDKKDAMLSVFVDAEGIESGFVSDIELLRQGSMKATDFFDKYGTHYAFAIRYGAMGILEQRFTKDSVTKILEFGSRIKYGGGFHIKGNVGVGEGGSVSSEMGLDYSDEKGLQSAMTMQHFMQDDFGEYRCIGVTGTTACKDGSVNADNAVPVMLDLKPITELLGPPFFTDFDTCVRLRSRRVAPGSTDDGGLEAALRAYLAGGDVGKEGVPVEYLMLTGSVRLIDDPKAVAKSVTKDLTIELYVLDMIVPDPGALPDSTTPTEFLGDKPFFFQDKGRRLLNQVPAKGELSTNFDLTKMSMVLPTDKLARQLGPYILPVKTGTNKVWVGLKAFNSEWKTFNPKPRVHATDVNFMMITPGKPRGTDLFLTFEPPEGTVRYVFDVAVSKLDMLDVFKNGLPTPPAEDD